MRRKRSFLAKHAKSEHSIQERFFTLLSHINHPAVFLTFAIPNQALAIITTSARIHFSKEGCKAGILDVQVCYASHCKQYIGLWIEFKKPGEELSPDQIKFKAALDRAGYKTMVAFSAQEAFRAWCDYFGISI